MAGATPMAVLGQPTTLLVVQHRHTLPRARTQPPARQGWPHCGHPSIYPSQPPTAQTHQHGAAIRVPLPPVTASLCVGVYGGGSATPPRPAPVPIAASGEW
jgi:hypothetical protein